MRSMVWVAAVAATIAIGAAVGISYLLTRAEIRKCEWRLDVLSNRVDEIEVPTLDDVTNLKTEVHAIWQRLDAK